MKETVLNNMKVVDYIAKYLKDYGINHFFGFQGGAISPLIDSFVNAGIEYVQNYQEQASGFCADAYARITNKLGVAVVTNGPGVTNLISGITNSYLDSSPCLFISGQVKTLDINTSPNIRQNGFQEINTVDIVKTITKYAVTIKESKHIKYELDKAINIATTGRKGAVLLDLPLNIQQEEIDENTLIEYQFDTDNQDDSNLSIDTVIKFIGNAKKPLIVAGGGIQSSGSYKLFKEFSKLTQIPSVSTLMGLDAISDLSCGFSGLYGNTFANLAVYNADLLIVLGSQLAKRQIGIKNYNRNGKIIHIDIDENELGHNIKPHIKINTDLYHFLFTINNYIKKNNTNFECFEVWHSKIKEWKTKYYDNCSLNKEGLDPVCVVRAISSILDKNTIICSDVGQNQMWVAQGFEVKEGQRLLNSGGLGCMGFSLPASIGVQIAAKNKKVIAFMGDGGFQMNQQELQLIVQRNLPIKIVVFNNCSLGMIQEGQKLYFDNRYYGTRIGYQAPNFKGLSLAYGVEYIQIKEFSEIDELQIVLNNDKIYLIEILLCQNPTLLLNQYNEQSIYEQDTF
jgi:acetolactate synthase-1/2/3 large subunit